MVTHANLRRIELDSIASTNDYLCELYRSGSVCGPVAVWAREQTKGKGRAGRVWHAIKGASLCMSVGFPYSAVAMPHLALVVGLAVRRSLLNVLHASGSGDADQRLRLKWPNDLVADGRKLGGILCEGGASQHGPYVVVGVGLNLKPVEVSSVLGGAGTISLYELGCSEALIDAPGLFMEISASISTLVNQAFGQSWAVFRSEFAQADCWLGRQVRVLDADQIICEGIAMGTDDFGRYLIDSETGIQSITAGDLSLRTSEVS